MFRAIWAGLILMGCATRMAASPTPAPAPLPVKEAEPNPVERACLEQISRSGERLASEEFATCARDSDCRGISALLSGLCGTIANARRFDAHLDEFQTQTAICDPVVQLVPRCLRLRPVCREGRCAGEPVSEMPDECTELRASLEADAQKANTCNVDAECTVTENDRPTSVAFRAGALDRQEALARACGTVPSLLYVVRHQPIESFCVNQRCMTEKSNPQFTTVVHDTAFRPPELDRECIIRQFKAAFTDWRKLVDRKRWSIDYFASLDARGRQNQFEFVAPADLSLETQRALASRLIECRAKPATWRGKPIAIRERFRITWIID